MEQNRNLEINPQTCGQSMTREARLCIVGKTIFSTNAAGKNRQLRIRKWN